jgi:hypothetical protein
LIIPKETWCISLGKEEKKVRFEVITAVRIVMMAFWVVMPCIYLQLYTASQPRTTSPGKEGYLENKMLFSIYVCKGTN